MEPKVKGKFETSTKVRAFQNPPCYILEKLNKSYDKKQIFGYHDALKICGAPKLCSKMASLPPTEGEFSEKFETSTKVKMFQNPSCYILEKLNKNYYKRNFF